MATLDHGILAAYAAEISRAFGLEVKAIAEPANERQAKALVARLHGQLRQVRPIASAASVGEALDALAACDGSAARRARRTLAELEDLVAAGTYDRTKRAERGRIFALLLVVFDLVALTGAASDVDDPEATLKLVRRARRAG